MKEIFIFYSLFGLENAHCVELKAERAELQSGDDDGGEIKFSKTMMMMMAAQRKNFDL